MNDLISRQAAISALTDEAECEPLDYSPLDAILTIKALPTAQPEHLHNVVRKINKAYKKAMNTPCIHKPMAWALYQVWKEYDRA